MSENESQRAVWTDESRCKACNICVSVCPSGAIAMRQDEGAVQGMMIDVVDEGACIGCRECELHCPDFAIFVAPKGFKFARLSSQAREMAGKIKNNNFMKPKDA